MSNINFDKLLSDYLQELKLKNPNPSNDPYVNIHLTNMKLSAEVCVTILKRYEELKSKEDD
ncbi:hypothetical protein [Clostridium peptidivorans]|uniref:hypothetical protein n=1 Tax=Clostridium peptidivorans TaxID=100174 RepID=UPI000BE307D6|nr:hypothetical protein [Clostridium peptidivorans]